MTHRGLTITLSWLCALAALTACAPPPAGDGGKAPTSTPPEGATGGSAAAGRGGGAGGSGGGGGAGVGGEGGGHAAGPADGGASSSSGNAGAGGGRDAGVADVARDSAGGGPADAGRDGGTGGDVRLVGAGDGGPPSRPELDGVCTPAIEYDNQVPTSTGGRRFDMHVPDVVATMQKHVRAICALIYRKPEEVKRVPRIKVVIDTHNGVAYAGGGEIHFSANYIGRIGGSDQAVAFEINGVLVHEGTHVMQYAAGGGGALVEAMADYVRFKAGWDRLSRRRPGGNWSDPYTTGGFFIAWIEDNVDKDFGYKVNMGMRSRDFSYPALVKQVSGKDIDTLWREYQAAIR